MQHPIHNKPISIVTVTYNSSRNLPAYIKSIISSGKLLIKELIIIENNSPEAYKTKEILDSYKRISKIPIKYIKSNDNAGFAKSCNLGAAKATSKYVLFLNPDTVVTPKSIRTLYQHAIKVQADIIGGISVKNVANIHRTVVRAPNLTIGLFEFTNLGKIFNIKRGNSDFYYYDIRNLYSSDGDKQVDAVGGAYLMVNKNSFIKLNGFDENYFMYLEDVDLGVRANKLGMKVIFCPHSKITHIGGASSKNKDKIFHQAWYSSRKYYFRKHGNKLMNYIIQPIFSIEEFVLKILTKSI